MARIYKEVKRPAEAVAWYLDLLGIELASLERLRAEATQMAARGNVDEANRVVAYLSAMVPMRPKFHAEIGDACQKSGLHELAFHHLQRAHLAFPEDASMTLKLARAAHQVGEVAYCAQLLQRLEGKPLPDEDLAQAMSLRDQLATAAK
jgi:hypothetical protein